ncbi:hypothetical protein [Pseudonocardia sp.]|uniref:hypothetical protein n=1 Tax=Pseudonocardia sp. TaxID=60912 RepID=UPI0026153134|nr:hypothetical protein [Pseudonocardia sp.]
MKRIRTALAVVALVGALTGCTAGVDGAASPSTGPATTATATATATGSGSGTPSVTPSSSGAGAVGPEEQRIATVLRAYQGAVASGDYATACRLSTSEASAQLVAAVVAGGGQATGCEQAMTAVFSQDGAAGAAAEAASTTTVEDVTIDRFNATITWTSTRQGEPRTDSAALQSVNGQWLLAGAA